MIKSIESIACVAAIVVVAACGDVDSEGMTNQDQEELPGIDEEATKDTGNTHAAQQFTPATCRAHFANTAVWMDCVGGSQRAWVQLESICKAEVNQVTQWYRLEPFERKTVRKACIFKATGANAFVRPY